SKEAALSMRGRRALHSKRRPALAIRVQGRGIERNRRERWTESSRNATCWSPVVLRPLHESSCEERNAGLASIECGPRSLFACIAEDGNASIARIGDRDGSRGRNGAQEGNPLRSGPRGGK